MLLHLPKNINLQAHATKYILAECKSERCLSPVILFSVAWKNKSPLKVSEKLLEACLVTLKYKDGNIKSTFACTNGG